MKTLILPLLSPPKSGSEAISSFSTTAAAGKIAAGHHLDPNLPSDRPFPQEMERSLENWMRKHGG